MHTVKLQPWEELTLGLIEKLRWKKIFAQQEGETGSCTLGNREVCAGQRKWKLIMKFRHFGTGESDTVSPNWMALLGWKTASLAIQVLPELQLVLPIILKKILADWILLLSNGLYIPSWDSNQIWFVLNMRSEIWVWPCFKRTRHKGSEV